MSTTAQPLGPRPPGPEPDRETQRRLNRLEGDLELLEQAVHDLADPASLAGVAAEGLPGGSGGGGGSGVEAGGPHYPSLQAWVEAYFAVMFARPVSPAVRWCASWWAHAEALSRLEALWRSWEAARLDPVRGMALWYRDVLDPQLGVLLATGGPFAQCTPDRHSPVRALPTEPAPPGYWVLPHQPGRTPAAGSQATVSTGGSA